MSRDSITDARVEELLDMARFHDTFTGLIPLDIAADLAREGVSVSQLHEINDDDEA